MSIVKDLFSKLTDFDLGLENWLQNCGMVCGFVRVCLHPGSQSDLNNAKIVFFSISNLLKPVKPQQGPKLASGK